MGGWNLLRWVGHAAGVRQRPPTRQPVLSSVPACTGSKEATRTGERRESQPTWKRGETSTYRPWIGRGGTRLGEKGKELLDSTGRWEKDAIRWNGRGTEVDGRWSKRRKKKKKNVVRDASQKRQRGEKERGRELFPWNLRRRGYTVRSERDKERDRRNDIRYLEGTTRGKKTVHASLSEEERCICGTRKDRGTRTVLRATSGGTKEGERETALEKESDNPCAERRKMERGEDRLTERGGRIYTSEQESPLLREGRAVIRRGRLFDRD